MESTLKLKPSSSSNKYPTTTSPNDSWTIEQLLFWSLDQYHKAAISKTNSHLGALRLQCENECDDVLMLHELAVNMKDKDSDGDHSNCADSGADVDGNKNNVKNQHDENMDPLTSALSLARKGVSVENENMDPQQQQQHEQQQLKQQPPTPTNTTTTTAAPKSSNTSSLLIISILSGPHASQTYKLQPKHTQPCLIGRSKGKKFLRNGISLSKDQEVSTTHGKFSVEEHEVVLEEHEVDHDDGNNNMDNNNDSQGQDQVQVQKKFYYTDVGSTNGSTVGEARLEANVRVEIEDGMELRIGNSTLKIVFG